MHDDALTCDVAHVLWYVDDITSGRKPYLAMAVTPVAAARDANSSLPPPPPPPPRKRPFVYVYDVSSEFMSDLLQVGVIKKNK